MQNNTFNQLTEKRKMGFFGHEIIFGEKTYVMGILNVTPDSFSDGGDFASVDSAFEHAREMIRQGADIIDLGGESSRPGHTQITSEEELRRILPILKRLSKETNAIISLDTIRADVADEAIRNGVHIINDIWGLQGDPDMVKVAAKHQTPVVIMHNQNGTEYHGDMLDSICTFLKRSIQIALEAGLSEEKIILDPGIGFGKTGEQNIELMSRLSEIKALGYPVLLGTSRKRFIGGILDLPPKERMEGTLATTVLGIAQGVDMVRVHDVAENVRAAKVTDAILRG